jgi:NhaA family Na+:H+ antiporter
LQQSTRASVGPIPITRLVRPLQEFLSTESAGGVLLLAAAIAALAWANMPGDSYAEFWNRHLAFDLDVVTIDESLRHWVNDALMAVFFFVVGLEIKRELLRGELSDRKSAALPVAAAFGGMVVPALIYVAFNPGEDANGWAIPMATDIAFAVGVLSLLGDRVPLGLKVFLLALAIVDDLGAISVIAIFYTEDLELAWLAGAGVAFALTVALGALGVRYLFVYVLVGVAAWLCVFESGVHATVAGVILGLLTPITPHYSEKEFDESIANLTADIEHADRDPSIDAAETRQVALQEIEDLARDSRPVLDRLEHQLHPWTSWVIIPVFALANAGVELGGGALRDAASSPVSLAVALGLIIGKPLGITLFAFAAVRLGVAVLPAAVRWTQIIGAGMIAGIGFTVSILIAELAFTDESLVDEAKLGILAGSVIIATFGFVALRLVARTPARNEPALARVEAPSQT